MYRSSINQTPNHRGSTISEALVMIALVVALLAVALPVLAATKDNAGVLGSKRNLMQHALAHAMYGADHNGDQWTNVTPHNLAEFGDAYNIALSNYIASIGGTNNPMVSNNTGELQTFLGWAEVPDSDGQIGLWRYPWNVYTMPIHLDNSFTMLGFGYYRMLNVQLMTEYFGGKVYDHVFYAPKHQVAVDAIGECIDAPFEFCIDPDSPSHVYWSSYSLSPAALFHPDVWTEPKGKFVENMDEIFERYPHAFQVLPYESAKFPDLKTHVMEHVWLQNTSEEAGDCNPAIPPAFGNYDGCLSWYFNASMQSEPATLFYDGHVRLLPLTEVQESHDKVLVWREDTPMGYQGYFGGEHAWWPGGEWTGEVNPSHHILTNGGILGRDTLGMPSAQ